MASQREPVGDWVLLIGLNRDRSTGSAQPLHEQLEVRLRELVRRGRLTAGARLPSSRALAEQLGVSRGIVLEAYAQLVAEGYLTASQGAPTRVAATAMAERPPLPAQSMLTQQRTLLAPSRPDPEAFPRDAWQRALRAVLREPHRASAGEPDPRGTPELRNALMEYLVRARAAAPEPEHTLIGGGFAQAFAVLCSSLRGRGLHEIAVEAPGWPPHRLIAEHHGLTPVEIPVDVQGLVVSELAASDCEVVVLTPAHQYPTGVVLGAERRAELLEWAEERDGLIIEDDYDSELRYDRGAVGALQGLAPERVCHIGSLSARLAPGLKLGWTLSPSWLTGALSYEAAVAGAGASAFEQLALADLILSGALDRHLRRMRARYGPQREALIASLTQALPDATVPGVAAGLFVPLLITGSGTRIELLGVGEPVGSYLLLGFAGATDQAIGHAVRLLAGSMAS